MVTEINTSYKVTKKINGTQVQALSLHLYHTHFNIIYHTVSSHHSRSIIQINFYHSNIFHRLCDLISKIRIVYIYIFIDLSP